MSPKMVRKPLRQQLLHRRDVVLDARHDAADLVVVVEAQRELLQVGEHLGAQLEQHLVADAAGVDELDVDEEPAEDHEAEEDEARLR